MPQVPKLPKLKGRAMVDGLKTLRPKKRKFRIGAIGPCSKPLFCRLIVSRYCFFYLLKHCEGLRHGQIVWHAAEISQALFLFYIEGLEYHSPALHVHLEVYCVPVAVANILLQDFE